MQLLQLQKEIQACTGFEFMTSATSVQVMGTNPVQAWNIFFFQASLFATAKKMRTQLR